MQASTGQTASTAVSTAVSAVLGDVVVLVRDTVTVFVRRLPQIMAIWLLGWLGNNVALQAALLVSNTSAWASLAVFSTSFLFTLVAVVLILRVCGDELGTQALIPRDEAEAQVADASLTRLVAVTLLPFLGLYAAFGQVQDQAARLDTEQAARIGFLSDVPSVLDTVRGLGFDHPWRLLALLVSIYVVRRLVDALHERTGWRPLGLLVALVEAFSILVIIFGGFTLFQRVTSWLGDRVFVQWLTDLGHAVTHLLAALDLRLPLVLHQVWDYTTGTLGPVVWPVVTEPLVWLAAAALVYGSKVLSLAELWRAGRPLTDRLPGASKFDPRADRLALRPTPPPGLRRMGSEIKEAFLGDVDDKYLPTFHSLRLVLRAGGIFLGSYVLVYTVLTLAGSGAQRLTQLVVGGRQSAFWFTMDPFLDLVQNVPWEPLRLCLLAVAFRRCLELFRLRGLREQAPAGASTDTRPAAAAVA